MRFPYIASDKNATSLMPWLTMSLEHRGRLVSVTGLLDTGSTVNVLPYGIGLALGAVWEDQPNLPPLAGSLRNVEVHGLTALASHPRLIPQTPVRLVFAWARSDDAPIIFGQVNFFMEFDACFYRSQRIFDLNLRDGRPEE